MKVDIWSDIRCPFCYIGKRKFEAALEQFEHKDKIEIEWHSFELDPNLQNSTESPAQYLADRYSRPVEWAMEMQENVSKTASEAGLQFNLDHSVIANSFDAHRLIQMAKADGLGDAVEEALFKAHFTDGKDISDHSELESIGASIGLDAFAVQTMLQGTDFSTEVRRDEQIATQIGINSVPFFIFNQKLAVSGAQAPETFLGAMRQAWS